MTRTGALKHELTLCIALLTLLTSPPADAAPAKPCYLTLYRSPLNPQVDAFKALRNKYEELRMSRAEPWHNCSSQHLKHGSKQTLHKLTAWEKLEAVKMEVDLAISVLQNQSEPSVSRDLSRVLGFLMPLRSDLASCMQHKPSHHKESGHLHKFKEQFQEFRTSNAEQSPECLEAAVGLNIVRLLKEDIGQVSHHKYHHRTTSS